MGSSNPSGKQKQEAVNCQNIRQLQKWQFSILPSKQELFI
jgi:hypothetical protein